MSDNSRVKTSRPCWETVVVGHFPFELRAVRRELRHDVQHHPPTSLITYIKGSKDSSMSKQDPWKTSLHMMHCRALTSNILYRVHFCKPCTLYLDPDPEPDPIPYHGSC